MHRQGEPGTLLVCVPREAGPRNHRTPDCAGFERILYEFIQNVTLPPGRGSIEPSSRTLARACAHRTPAPLNFVSRGTLARSLHARGSLAGGVSTPLLPASCSSVTLVARRRDDLHEGACIVVIGERGNILAMVCGAALFLFV